MEFVKTTTEKAKAIARSLRMDAELQETVTTNLRALQEGEAWEIVLNAEEKSRRTTIKGQIERIAVFNEIPVAVRTRGTDKLVCWKLSQEEIIARRQRGEALQAGRATSTGGRRRK